MLLNKVKKDDAKCSILNKLIHFVEIKSTCREYISKAAYISQEMAREQSHCRVQSACDTRNKRKAPNQGLTSGARRSRHEWPAPSPSLTRELDTVVNNHNGYHQKLPIVFSMQVPRSSAISSYFSAGAGRSELDAAFLRPLFSGKKWLRSPSAEFFVSEAKGEEEVDEQDSARTRETCSVDMESVTKGSRFFDSSDDEEYEVTSVADGFAIAVVRRTSLPHDNPDKRSWDCTYLKTKLSRGKSRVRSRRGR